MLPRHCVIALASLGLFAFGAASAAAIEYRLRVANVRDEAFTSFLTAGELHDGATGPGLERLAASLDTGDFPKAVLLYDRHVQTARESTARAYRAVPVRADVKPGGEGKDLWDEARWEGTPGEQSLWIVAPQGRRPGELYRTAIRGQGQLRYFAPYNVPSGTYHLPVVRFPLDYLFSREGDADFWAKRIAPVLDLAEGIGVIDAARDGMVEADQAYIVVTHGAGPTTYTAILAWRERYNDRESPGKRFLRIRLR